MLPTGTVTLLLTDVEGSTRLWEEHPEVMAEVIQRHDDLIEKAVEANGGVLVKSKGEGDSTFSVFSRPSDAVATAVEIQRALGAEPWPEGIAVRVRGAIHTGEAAVHGNDYYGSTVNRCARMRATAHGGQIVCSQATSDLVADGVPGVTMRNLGTHRLKDLERPERIYQVGDGEFPSLRSLEAFRHNLPSQRTSFVGRDEELIRVEKLLAENRLLTLTGIGGCGKSRLSLQVAAENIDAFEDGVFFCELAPVSEPAEVPTQLARSVGMSLDTPGATRPVREELLEFLAGRHALVVLDNCEHLIEACADLVDELLDRCPGVRVLATSRESLEVEGERTFSVPSLGLPSAEEISESESVQLFCDRAAAVRSDFALSAESAGDVAEICRRLDGIPLAIELAAAQVDTLTPAQITERLNDRFLLLTGGRRRVQRQHTLGAALDWSYDLLSDNERSFLRRLSVFPAEFTLEAAEAIGGHGPQGVALLRALVSKSLVATTEEPTGRRYRLLETVRLYAEEKLLESGEADDVRWRHCAHFREWLVSSDDEVPDEVGPMVVAEGPNIRAAVTWALEHGRSDLVAQIAGRSLPLWMSGNLDEGERWISEGLRVAGLDPAERLLVLISGGWIAMTRLDFAAWGGRAEEAVELVAHVDDPMPAAHAYALLALYRSLLVFLFGQRQLADEARELAQRGEHALGAWGEPSWRLQVGGVVRMVLSLTYAALADFDAATRVLLPGKADPDRPSSPWQHSLLSVLHSIRGSYDEALEQALYVDAAIDQIGGLDEGFGVWLRSPQGLALAGIGRHEEADEFMRELLSGPASPGPGVATACTTVLAAMADLRGDGELAARLIGAASAAMERGEYRSPLDFILRDHHLSRLRGFLSPEALDRYIDEGRALSLSEAMDLGTQGSDVELTSTKPSERR